MAHAVVEPVQYQINFNGSYGGVSPEGGVNPAATYVCNVYRNTVLIGTISYSTGGVATFATVGGTAGILAVGDFLTVVGNATPDGAIQNFSATFAMQPG
jgi:hypothetical protein